MLCVRDLLPPAGLSASAVRRGSVAENIVSAFNLQLSAVYQAFCQFASGTSVDGLSSRAGDFHLPGTFLLRFSFQINQPDAFKFIQRHDNR